VTVRVDHIVFWVEDPLRSVEFYESALGFPGVRVEEFREGKVGFPSVRISSDTIIDLMPKMMAPFLNGMPGTEGSAGNKVNHFCLAMGKSEYTELHARLAARGVVAMTMTSSFGAQGTAPEAFYFTDPDGNVLEARYYD
jgi:catechol 2,3-dioxygenase-like lactoylglutathione lyase family enzyme